MVGPLNMDARTKSIFFFVFTLIFMFICYFKMIHTEVGKFETIELPGAYFRVAVGFPKTAE